MRMLSPYAGINPADYTSWQPRFTHSPAHTELNTALKGPATKAKPDGTGESDTAPAPAAVSPLPEPAVAPGKNDKPIGTPEPSAEQPLDQLIKRPTITFTRPRPASNGKSFVKVVEQINQFSDLLEQPRTRSDIEQELFKLIYGPRVKSHQLNFWMESRFWFSGQVVEHRLLFREVKQVADEALAYPHQWWPKLKDKEVRLIRKHFINEQAKDTDIPYKLTLRNTTYTTLKKAINTFLDDDGDIKKPSKRFMELCEQLIKASVTHKYATVAEEAAIEFLNKEEIPRRLLNDLLAFHIIKLEKPSMREKYSAWREHREPVQHMRLTALGESLLAYAKQSAK